MMINPFTEGLELEEFLYVVVNEGQKSSSFLITKKETKEESKSDMLCKEQEKKKPDISTKQEIYSIKVATHNMTKLEIIELIKDELLIVESDIHIWNNMMRAIMRMSMADVIKSDSELILVIYHVFSL